MSNSNRSSYKGYAITTRWVELVPASGRHARRFNASFTVDSAGPNEMSWQQFLKAIFDTAPGAADNALTAARKAIDLDLATA
jgi:hypothetical protein